jgi:hypothetical protein
MEKKQNISDDNAYDGYYDLERHYSVFPKLTTAQTIELDELMNPIEEEYQDILDGHTMMNVDWKHLTDRQKEYIMKFKTIKKEYLKKLGIHMVQNRPRIN